MRPSYSGKTSYRRWLLNECLALNANVFGHTCIVLDVGGERNIGEKGFRYPEEKVKTWINLNFNIKAEPDLVADARMLPIMKNSVDVVVCTEVLEHLCMPAQCIDEIYRVMKPSGIFIGSVPFIFPVHNSPNDYYRYTEAGLRNLLHQFSDVRIEPMGGGVGAIAQLLIEPELFIAAPSRLMRSFMRRLAIALCRRDQKEQYHGASRLTTGWFWRCVK